MIKIFSICSALVFAFTISMVQKANAQDYQITFAGTGASSTVSSVEVENLTTGKTITLNGGDILHLTSVVGISQPETSNSSGMRIYPNPMTDNSILELHAQEAGEAVITVYEMTGKTVAKISTYLENGRQEFRLSGLKNGLYLINARGNSFQYSGKILSSGQASGNPGIEKISNTNESRIEKISKKEYSITKGTVDMYYAAGERLKFKAISGIYSKVKTDIPKEDKTLSFNFIECTDGDGNNYPVVEIGTQTWMAENLKTTKNNNGELIGTTTPDTIDISSEDSPTYQWAYDGNENSVSSYGRLYTWYAVDNTCPAGWHVPQEIEWDILLEYLGGAEVASVKLKETGIDHWRDSNTSSTNETGFSARPGGRRDLNSFIDMGSKGQWFSIHFNPFGPRKYSPSVLEMGSSSIFTLGGNWHTGYSVRCLSDYVKTFPTTSDATEITMTSAICGGNITDDWGYPITARGVCWSSLHLPTVSDSITSDGTGTGAFTSSLKGLQPNRTYIIRAYFTNSEGTVYGDPIWFTTFSVWPSLSTTAILDVTQTSVICGGNIINMGASTVTAKGVCWSTNENPTIADGLATNSSELDSFTCSLTGLASNTKYYVRAYATNSIGTGYGNEILFATKGESGSVSDIDGNTYSTIEIGTQTWMAENLKTTKYNIGTTIPLVIDPTGWEALSSPGFCWYNNAIANKAIYGALYNWYTVNTGKLCPTGWHVPADAEWTVLISYLGGEFVADGKLKEVGLAHWANPNQDATNETGFTALPGGCRDNSGAFGRIGGYGSWWSSTEAGAGDAWHRYMGTSSNFVLSYYDGKRAGYSVRCLKDE